jgi:hypothetical protein
VDTAETPDVFRYEWADDREREFLGKVIATIKTLSDVLHSGGDRSAMFPTLRYINHQSLELLQATVGGISHCLPSHYSCDQDALETAVTFDQRNDSS